VLIYCNDDLADEICKVENSIRIDSETDYKMIRKLDHKMTPLGKYRLCFTTDGDTMRGFDYRAPNNGISLFLARSLQTERDFH
jgi:intein/homing endonuclease